MSGKLSRTVLRRGKGSNPFFLVEYASYEFQQALRKNGMRSSMSRKGDCWDNAVAESFYSTLKTELIYHNKYQNRRQAKRDISHYIEVYYNRIRLHSNLNYKSSENYEKRENNV